MWVWAQSRNTPTTQGRRLRYLTCTTTKTYRTPGRSTRLTSRTTGRPFNLSSCNVCKYVGIAVLWRMCDRIYYIWLWRVGYKRIAEDGYISYWVVLGNIGWSISKNTFLGVFYVVVDFVQIFSDLCKSSIFGNLHLDRHLHIHLRVHTDLYLPFYFYNSSSS